MLHQSLVLIDNGRLRKRGIKAVIVSTHTHTHTHARAHIRARWKETEQKERKKHHSPSHFHWKTLGDDNRRFCTKSRSYALENRVPPRFPIRFHSSCKDTRHSRCITITKIQLVRSLIFLENLLVHRWSRIARLAADVNKKYHLSTFKAFKLLIQKL